MRYLSWIFGIALFLMALGFAIKNSEIVTLHYYLGYQWQAPLVLIILAALCIGTGIGVAATFGFGFRQQREIIRLHRELNKRSSQVEMQTPGPVNSHPVKTTQRLDDGI